MKHKLISLFFAGSPLTLLAQENNRAYEAGRATGKLIGVLLVILLCIWLIWRTKRKR